MLIVPQPINATKNGRTHGNTSTGGGGRKYNCKMCPQVNKKIFLCMKLLIIYCMIFFSSLINKLLIIIKTITGSM